MTDRPGIASAVHRSAAMHRDTTPDLHAALRLLVTLGESFGEGLPHREAARVAARHLEWLEQSTETVEWAIEWTSVPVGDPDRFEPHHDPSIAARLAHTYSSHGTRIVSRAVLHGPYGEST